jgi:beta-lactam-binding protein with PASTA domain
VCFNSYAEEIPCPPECLIEEGCFFEPPPQAEPVAIPGGLVGGQLVDVTAILIGMGLVPELEYVPSEAPAGTVVAVFPASGTLVAPGSAVTLHVSTGIPAEPDPPDNGYPPEPTPEPTETEPPIEPTPEPTETDPPPDG